jgi:phosphatidylglycerophosphate synthase
MGQWAFAADTLYDAATLLVVCLLVRSEWHVQLASSREAATTFLQVCAARIIDGDRKGSRLQDAPA